MYQTECLICSVNAGLSYGNGGFWPATICIFDLLGELAAEHLEELGDAAQGPQTRSRQARVARARADRAQP